jgi:hypothetical protein
VSEFRVVLINFNEFKKWLGKLGENLVADTCDQYLNQAVGVDMVAKIKDQFGEYQEARGPYPAWAPLKPDTIAGKKNGDTPLLEEGDIQASTIMIDMGPFKKLIGCTDLKTAWMEYGVPSKNVPARPIVRPIVWMEIPNLKKGIRKALVKALVTTSYSVGGAL